MKKTHKGTTLVEVLVSIAVFAILSVAMISCLLGMTKIVSRQEEYVRFEMILSDMEFYYQAGKIDSSNISSLYFTDKFTYISSNDDPSNKVYELIYHSDGNKLIVESIKHISGRVILENITIPKISEVQQ